jgi:hypothetical protein
MDVHGVSIVILCAYLIQGKGFGGFTRGLTPLVPIWGIGESLPLFVCSLLFRTSKKHFVLVFMPQRAQPA